MYGISLFSDVTQIIGGIEVAGGVESTFSFATYAEADAFMQAASNAGFNYLYGSQGCVHFSNVIGGAGGSYGLSAVNTAVVETAGGASEVTISGLAADTGLNVVDGGVTFGVAAAQLGAAVVTGVGIGLKSYEQYPEFWRDLSNGLFDGIGGNEVMPTIVRAVEGGGIRNYVRKQDVDTLKHNLYNLAKIRPEVEIEPYEEGLQNISVTADFNGVNSAILEAMGHTQVNVIPPATGAETYNRAYQAFKQHFPNNEPNYLACQASTGEYYGTPVSQVRVQLADVDLDLQYNVSRILASGVYRPETGSISAPNVDLADNYNRDGSFDRTLQTTFSNAISLYGGLGGDVQGTTSRGVFGGLLSKVLSTPALIYNNQSDLPEDEEDFWDKFADWLARGFTQPVYNPQTRQITRVMWLPLTIPKIIPDTDVQPDPAAKEGTQEDPSPIIEELLKIIYKFPWIQPPSEPDKPTPPPTPPTPVFSGRPGLWSIYNPTNSEIAALGQYLWSSNIIDIIEKFFKNSPLEAIISLHMIYATPTTSGRNNIILGYLDSGVAADVVVNQYEEIDCGTVFIAEHFGDARDYTDTQVEIFLPFIGMRRLNTADIINSYVNVKFQVDVLTGVILAQIFITKSGITQCLYQYEGNCAVQVPLTAADRSRLIAGMMATVTGAVTMGAAGGPVGAIAGAVGGAVQNFQKSATINRSGQLSGNSGAMGIKIPYILITRKKANPLGMYYGTMGAAVSKTCKLSECSGYTVVRDAQIHNLKCNAWERDSILQSLKSGIII